MPATIIRVPYWICMPSENVTRKMLGVPSSRSIMSRVAVPEASPPFELRFGASPGSSSAKAKLAQQMLNVTANNNATRMKHLQDVLRAAVCPEIAGDQPEVKDRS